MPEESHEIARKNPLSLQGVLSWSNRSRRIQHPKTSPKTAELWLCKSSLEILLRIHTNNKFASPEARRSSQALAPSHSSGSTSRDSSPSQIFLSPMESCRESRRTCCCYGKWFFRHLLFWLDKRLPKVFKDFLLVLVSYIMFYFLWFVVVCSSLLLLFISVLCSFSSGGGIVCRRWYFGWVGAFGAFTVGFLSLQLCTLMVALLLPLTFPPSHLLLQRAFLASLASSSNWLQKFKATVEKKTNIHHPSSYSDITRRCFGNRKELSRHTTATKTLKPLLSMNIHHMLLVLTFSLNVFTLFRGTSC